MRVDLPDRVIEEGSEGEHPPISPASGERPQSEAERRRDGTPSRPSPRRLDPERIPDHIDALFRAACALCGSRHDAEDLVQETIARVLKRPRFVMRDRELGYLLRALRNTYYSHHRAAARRPTTTELVIEVSDRVSGTEFRASEILEAVASAPAVYRDAVIAVDIVGMSYREAARALRAREATITTRLHRGRQHVARILIDAEQAN
jgi:RNA polymerase sigma-70 factor (ECF subfamily)